MGSGTLTTNASGHITNISGLLANSSATASITGVDDLYGTPDNDLVVTPAYVTFAGISFDADTLGALNLADDLLGNYVLASSVTNGIGSLTGMLTAVWHWWWTLLRLEAFPQEKSRSVRLVS